MRKFLLLISFLLISLYGNAQMAVVDAGATSQLIRLSGSALDQVTTLSRMFGILEKTENARRFVSGGIVVLGNVKRIISLGNNAINSANYLVEFMKNKKITSPKKALDYSNTCIRSIESIVNNLSKASSLIATGFVEADPLQRVDALTKVEKDMELEAQNMAKVELQIKHEESMRAMQNYMLQTQGLIK